MAKKTTLAASLTYGRCYVYTSHTIPGLRCPLCNAEIKGGVEHHCSKPRPKTKR